MVFRGLNLLDPHALQHHFRRELTLGYANDLHTILPRTVRSECELLEFFFRINTDALQRALELFQVFRQHLLFQRLRRLRVLERTIVHRNDLLDIGRDDCA